MGVLAIRSATGRRRWRAAYVSPTGEQGAHPKAIAVSHDGRSLFLGGSFDVNMRFVVAFDTVDGSLEWEREVAEAGQFGELKALIVAPDGDAIYGAGTLEIDAANSPNIGIVVLALDRVSGSLLWRREWDRPGPQVDGVSDIAVRPDGSTVYVSGDAPEVTVDPELVVHPGMPQRSPMTRRREISSGRTSGMRPASGLPIVRSRSSFIRMGPPCSLPGRAVATERVATLRLWLTRLPDLRGL